MQVSLGQAFKGIGESSNILGQQQFGAGLLGINGTQGRAGQMNTDEMLGHCAIQDS